MKKQTIIAIMIALSLTACNQASDLQTTSNNNSQGAELYTSLGCNTCHGEDGKTSALGVSRIIADIAETRDIENALYTLKHANTAKRDTIMIDIAINLTKEDIQSLSNFIATL